MRMRKVPAGVHPSLLHPAYASTVERAPKRPPVRLPQGATELSGPGFDRSLLYPNHDDLTRQVNGGEAAGQRIIVTGRILDENGDPVPNTLLEIWQCNAAGRYHHDKDNHDAPLDPYFRGCGRLITGSDGAYRFTSIRPGAYPWRNHRNAWRPAHIHFSVFGHTTGRVAGPDGRMQAPHILVVLFARGLLAQVVTRMYFDGDVANQDDPVLALCGARAATLIAKGDAADANAYIWNVSLQGADETVFFDA